MLKPVLRVTDSARDVTLENVAITDTISAHMVVTRGIVLHVPVSVPILVPCVRRGHTGFSAPLTSRPSPLVPAPDPQPDVTSSQHRQRSHKGTLAAQLRSS